MMNKLSRDDFKSRLLTRFSDAFDEIVDSEPVTDFSLQSLDATAAAATDGMRAAYRLGDRIGAFYTSSRARRELGDVSREAVSKRVRSHRMLRVVTADGVSLYPAFQFDGRGGLVPHIADILEILLDAGQDGWSVAYWLTAPLAEFDGRTAIHVLLGGDGAEIHAVASLARDDAAAWQAANRA